MSAVVVIARCDSEKLDADLWQVKKGDLGVLRWKAHRTHHRCFVPYVVWDRDPERKVRKLMISSITIIGLHTSTSRLLLVPLPR
jgi:hypothetical protein